MYELVAIYLLLCHFLFRSMSNSLYIYICMSDMCISNSIATLSIYSHNQSSTSYSIHILHSIAFFAAATGWHCQDVSSPSLSPFCLGISLLWTRPRTAQTWPWQSGPWDLSWGKTFKGPLGKWSKNGGCSTSNYTCSLTGGHIGFFTHVWLIFFEIPNETA